MKSTIKILLAVFALFLYTESAIAQVPQMFNYQGIARDAKGNPLSNQKMSLKISVLPAADATSTEYEETQMVNTNEFGLYTLQIGNGTAVTGEMKTVKWETGNKYIKVAIDPAGGTNYMDAGTSQLLSVPYAIYADKAGTAAGGGHDKTRTGTVSSDAAHTGGDANYHAKFTALNTIGKSLIYDNGTNIGIGTNVPAARFHISQNVAAVQEHIRMQNLATAGAGRFTMYNDGASAYATFTKYGTTYAGGYAGVATMYPYANLLAFGNNGVAANDGQGRFLISTGGNVGISMFKGGTSKLKFHADFTTENVGIGGNAAPANRVHLNNSDGTDMTVGVTNNTTGHTATDGLVIRENGSAASIINKENSTLGLGTNNTINMTLTAAGTAEFSGQVKIAGGAPGAGKVLTSDANGLASWTAPAGGGNISGNGTANYTSRFLTPTTLGTGSIYDDGINVGIGTNTPHAQLQLSNMVTAKKMVLYEDANNGNEFYGFGVNAGVMRYQTSTGANHAFYVATSPSTSTELMRIQSNGNVGIGTATPAAKLEINGQVKITGGTPGAGKVLTSDAAGLATWTTPAAGGGNISGTGNILTSALTKFVNANTITSSSLFEDAGNVGIGIVAPHAPIHLTNTIGRKVVLYETADNDHQYFGLGMDIGLMRYQVSSTTYHHAFYAGATAATSNELMRIQGNGNVGIGTATPTVKLEVAGQVKITGGSPGAGKVLLSDAAGLASWGIAPSAVNSGTINRIAKYVTANNVDESSLLFDDGTGLGIGTTTPHAPLHLSNGIGNRKIVLYEGADNDHQFYGFGVNAGIIRYQVPATTNFHVFYAGATPSTSTELMRIQGNGNVGIGTAAATQRLTVYNGTSTGTYTTTGWVHSSDARLKTNIKPLENSLDKILHLNGVSYNWKTTPNDDKQIGFIAQDVERVFPEVVVIDKEGNYGMAYQNLAAPMVEAIKELNAKNELLQKQIEAQEKMNADLLKRLEALENK